jgi:hypothetical protein
VNDNKGPIFIGGLSNSGKTELRKILETHEDITMARRTLMWSHFYLAFGDLTRGSNLKRCIAAMLEAEGLREFKIDPVRLLSDFSEGPASYARLFGLVHQHRAERLQKRRWGEQLGLVERFADPILQTFPTAKMIHLIRHPSARFAEGAARSSRRRGALGSETAMWLDSAGLANRNSRLYPERYLIVRFEDLAVNPRGTTQAVCSFLGEECTSSMSEVAATTDFDRALPQDLKSSEPGVRARSGAFELAFVNRYSRNDLNAMGYSTASSISLPGEMPFLLIDWPLNRVTMTARRIINGRTMKPQVPRWLS